MRARTVDYSIKHTVIYNACIIFEGWRAQVAYEQDVCGRSCFDFQGRKYDRAACYFRGTVASMSEREREYSKLR